MSQCKYCGVALNEYDNHENDMGCIKSLHTRFAEAEKLMRSAMGEAQHAAQEAAIALRKLADVEKREQILREFVEMVPGTIDSVLHAASLTKSVDRWLPVLQHEARVALGQQHGERSEKDFKESLKFLNDKYGGALKRLAEGPDAPKE